MTFWFSKVTHSMHRWIRTKLTTNVMNVRSLRTKGKCFFFGYIETIAYWVSKEILNGNFVAFLIFYKFMDLLIEYSKKNGNFTRKKKTFRCSILNESGFILTWTWASSSTSSSRRSFGGIPFKSREIAPMIRKLPFCLYHQESNEKHQSTTEIFPTKMFKKTFKFNPSSPIEKAKYCTLTNAVDFLMKTFWIGLNTNSFNFKYSLF